MAAIRTGQHYLLFQSGIRHTSRRSRFSSVRQLALRCQPLFNASSQCFLCDIGQRSGFFLCVRFFLCIKARIMHEWWRLHHWPILGFYVGGCTSPGHLLITKHGKLQMKFSVDTWSHDELGARHSVLPFHI